MVTVKHGTWGVIGACDEIAVHLPGTSVLLAVNATYCSHTWLLNTLKWHKAWFLRLHCIVEWKSMGEILWPRSARF